MVQMTEERSFPATLRIAFRKVGALQYISHLDLMRTMTRVLVRARLPIRYTEGFHPIPHLVFSAPLPVGAESPREFLDVVAREPIDLEEARARLNAGLPPELEVEEIYYPTRKLREIVGADYEICLPVMGADDALAARVGEALNRKPLMIFKRTKGGDRDVDVSSAIAQASATADGEGLSITLRLVSDNGSFLNPDYLIRYLEKHLPEIGPLVGYTVRRTRLLDRDGRDFR